MDEGSSMSHIFSKFHEYHPWNWVAFCSFAFVVYYKRYIVSVPRLITGDEKMRRLVMTSCPAALEPFRPTFWCYNAFLQTVLGSNIRSHPPVTYDREYLNTPDGGQVILSWMQTLGVDHSDYKTQPTVLLLPGLTGSCQAGYMLNLVHQVRKLGIRAVVFNNRGNGPLAELKTARTYNARNTEDLRFVVEHVHRRYPEAPLMATGISLGGLILMHYVSESGNDSGLAGAMVCSTAWDVFQSVVSLEHPAYKYTINWALARALVARFEEYFHMFEHIVDTKAVRDAKTIREFDHHFTAKVFGYDGHEDYYRDACIHRKLMDVQTPVLVLQAADDPFCPVESLPTEEFGRHANVALVLTKRGGHVGFLDSLWPSGPSYMDRLFSQFVTAVFSRT